MKKYTIAIAVFLLTAAMANAQTTKKTSTSSPAAKTSHSASAKKSTSSTASVTPADACD